MLAQVYSGIDPVPYLQFLTVLTGVLLAGLTGSDVMKAYKVTSQTNNENIKEEVNIHEEKLLTVKRLDPKDIDEEAFTDDTRIS